MAQLNRVDVVTLQIRVHDCEKHLGKQVEGVHNHGEDKQPASLVKMSMSRDKNPAAKLGRCYNIPALSSHCDLYILRGVYANLLVLGAKVSRFRRV